MVQAFTLARALSSVGWTMPRLQPDDPIHKSHLARALRLADGSSARSDPSVTGTYQIAKRFVTR